MTMLPVIVGPTAVGKSQVALQVARKLGGEIISADSVQVYRGLDIGAGKPSREERALVPHHLLDIADPRDNYTAADFQRDAQEAIKGIQTRNRLPLLVGGTGLYVRALLQGFAFSASGENQVLRQKLSEEAKRLGMAVLHQRLTEVDPEAAEKIHPHDLRRVIRALEVYSQSQVPISGQRRCTSGTSDYDVRMFILDMPRELLYRRIEQRVEKMLAEGLVEEVKGLLSGGVSPQAKSLQSLGYRQMVAYLQGEEAMAAAVERIKRDTRHYAKRQLTWFRREPDAIWLNISEKGGTAVVAEKICAILAGDS